MLKPGGRAYIFCDRIAAMPGASTPFSIRLGDVVAHEVGHLVLPWKGHSRTGIMRAAYGRHAAHLQSFDKLRL